MIRWFRGECVVDMLCNVDERGATTCRVTERGTFSEEEAAYLIKQVLEGVAYLHFKGIVHGDLKLENILLEGNMPCVTVKIADFGLSKVFSSSPMRATVCGSPLYMAPELLTLDQKSELAPAVDVWSVGVILFILLAGYAPFGVTPSHVFCACNESVRAAHTCHAQAEQLLHNSEFCTGDKMVGCMMFSPALLDTIALLSSSSEAAC